MRDADDLLPAEPTRPLALSPGEVAAVLETAARLQRHEPGAGPAAAGAAASELARAMGIDAGTLTRAAADHKLETGLTGLTVGDRRWFALKRFVAGFPGSLLPRPDTPRGNRVGAFVLATRANTERKAGRNRLAIWLAHRSLARDPSCYKAWMELGRALENLNRLEEACDAYRLAVEHGLAESPLEDPVALSNALNNLAILVEGAVGQDVAEAMYLKAMAVRPTGGVAAYNLALLYKTTGRFAEALPWIELAATLRPDDEDVQKELGIVRAAARP